MAELDNIQNQLHLMLRQYVENKRQTGETIVGGEIPYPTLIVFVGNKICNEALNGILPEMKRHWHSWREDAIKNRAFMTL